MSRLATLLDSTAGRVLRYVVSAALVAWFALRIDWHELRGLHGQFAWSPVLAGLGLAGITYPLHAWRWWLLLRAQGLALPLSWAHVVTWICQFYNSFLLGGLGGDTARVFYVCRDAATQRAGGLAAIVLDRVMGLVVLMSLAAFALAAKASAFAREPGLRWLFIAALAVFVGGAITAAILLRLEPARWPAALRRALGETRLATVADLLARTRRSHRELALALLGSYAIWLFDFAAVWLFARAIGLPLPFLETCIAVSAAYAATTLPISVGGHGVREGALLAMLALFGLIPAAGPDHDRALLLAVMVWANTMLWSLVGGLAVLGARRLVPPVTNAQNHPHPVPADTPHAPHDPFS